MDNKVTAQDKLDNKYAAQDKLDDKVTAQDKHDIDPSVAADNNDTGVKGIKALPKVTKSGPVTDKSVEEEKVESKSESDKENLETAAIEKRVTAKRKKSKDVPELSKEGAKTSRKSARTFSNEVPADAIKKEQTNAELRKKFGLKKIDAYVKIKKKAILYTIYLGMLSRGGGSMPDKPNKRAVEEEPGSRKKARKDPGPSSKNASYNPLFEPDQDEPSTSTVNGQLVGKQQQHGRLVQYQEDIEGKDNPVVRSRPKSRSRSTSRSSSRLRSKSRSISRLRSKSRSISRLRSKSRSISRSRSKSRSSSRSRSRSRRSSRSRSRSSSIIRSRSSSRSISRSRSRSKSK